MKIGIMCLGTHQQILWRLYKILRGSHQITLLVSDDVFDVVKERVGITEETHCVIRSEQESLWSYLRRAKIECNKNAEYVVNVGMYHPYPIGYILHYIFKPNSRLLVFINTADSWMGPLPRYNKNVLLRTIIRENLKAVGKKIALSKFDGILVELPTVQEYIQSNLNSSETPVRTFQPVYTLSTNEDHDDELVKFVIPGTVTTKRRDYHTVVKVLHDLTNQHLAKFQITFLGRPKDGALIEEFRSLIAKGCNLRYYDADQWIPAQEFENQISKSDVILLPQKYDKSELFDEIYGRTGGTGGVSEAIMHSKPIILPDYFPDVESIQTSTIWYEGRYSLQRVMTDMIENSEWLLGLKEEAYKNSQAFTPDKQLAFFEKLLDEFH